MNVVVKQCRQQVVGGTDSMKITGEMKIDILHRYDLGVAAASRSTLYAKAGPKARLAQTHHGLLANAVQAIAQADRGSGLTFSGRRRRNGGHQD